MGIQGLLSLCLRKQKQCCDLVDLVEEARQKNGVEILVDFYSFVHMVLQNFRTSLSHFNQNLYLRILGGEYSSLARYLTGLIKNLLSLDIKLSFFIDGSKGSSKELTKLKMDTWISRYDKEIKTIQDILSVCYQHKNIEDLSSDANIRPVLLEVVVISVLRECGCEIVCFQGEADDKIAKQLLARTKAIAIFSDDSDFSIFKDCRFIPRSLFDINGDLQLDSCEEIPDKPLRLQVGIITTQKVVEILNLPSHDHLVEMCIVAGNDFTKPFMKERENLLYQLDINKPQHKLENIAQWIKKYGKVENHPLLKNVMEHNEQFASAVHFSRNFYNLKLEEDSCGQPVTNRGFLTKLITERIETGELGSAIICMHNCFYWHRSLLEDINGGPGIEILLSNIRSCIYRMLLPLDEQRVIEYGRSPNFTIMPASVTAGKWKWLPQLDQVNKEKIFVNLRIFHKIMSQQEPGLRTGDWPQNWFDRYGRRNGFIFYCLRYFLLLNRNQNLFIEENEFLALFSLVFAAKDQNQYQHIALRPSVRCITIVNWLQDIYRHAYCFLGGLLFVQHEFPTPQDLFSGSMWVLYYYCCNSDYYPPSSEQNLCQAVDNARKEMDHIIHEKRHMIHYLVDGVFYFNT